MFFRDLVIGTFNIISPAYKSGRAIMELMILVGIYSSLSITFVNILTKIHLLWLVPLSLLIGIIIGGCIIRSITVIRSCNKDTKDDKG